MQAASAHNPAFGNRGGSLTLLPKSEILGESARGGLRDLKTTTMPTEGTPLVRRIPG
jgi:hypothetical protein